jgi:hypothetical protein
MLGATANERDENRLQRGLKIFVACFREGSGMKNSDLRRGLCRRLGVATAAVLALAAASQQRAEAVSMASPGTAPAAKYATGGLTTEVRHGGGGGGGGHGGGGFHGGGGGFHGGGGGFHGGGFHGGGVAFHGGGFRAAPAFHGGYHYGGFRQSHYSGYRYAYRPHFQRHHHFFHRRFYYAPSYYYYPHRYCRVIWTYYGPRKICRYRPWHHYHHHWRHHRHHYGYYW